MQSRSFLVAATFAGLVFLPGIASAAISATPAAGLPVELSLQALALPETPALVRGDAAPKLILAVTEEEKKKLAAKKKAEAEAAAAKKKTDEEAAAVKKKGSAEGTSKKKEEAAAPKKPKSDQAGQQNGDDGDDDEEQTSPTYTGQGQTCPRWDNSCRR